MCVHHRRRVAAVVARAERNAGVVDDLLDFVGFFERPRDRFFNVNRFACLRASRDDRQPQFLRRRQHHSVDLGVLDRLVKIRGGFLDAEFLATRAQCVFG